MRQWLLYYKRWGPQDKSFPSFYRQKVTKYNSSKQQSSFSYNFFPTVYSTAAVEHKFPISMTQHPTQSHVISMPPNYFKIHCVITRIFPNLRPLYKIYHFFAISAIQSSFQLQL